MESDISNSHQYQCRACILVDGINLREDENEDQITEKVKYVLTCNLEEEVHQEFDKCHCVGPV